MKKLNSYDNYKDSGVPWLENIPEQWEAIKTKHLFRERVQKGYPNEPLLAATQTKGVVPKSMYENRTVEAQKDLHLLKLVEPGDFVISLRSFQGGIEYAYYRGIISPAYTVMVPNKRILPAYYRHLAKSKKFISLLQTCVTGIREGQNINYEMLRKTPLPVPTEDEQQQISRYLDWQTSKINKFIKAKKKLIALLKEQKQNVINEAVTKGINPDVEMKDSGVKWLGQIPAHWEIGKTKHVCSLLRDGTHLPPPRVDNGYPLLSVRNIVDGKFINRPDDSNISKEDFENLTRSFEVKENDIVLAIVGATLGKVAIVEKMLPFTIQRSLAVFRPKSNILLYRFLYYFFCSISYQKLLWNNVGFSAQPGIYLGKLANFHIVTPAINEQQAIVVHIEKETAIIDKTIARTEREIELIQEYRTRLVSDVVTGKVDVRSVEIPDFEPAPADLEVQDDEESEDELVAEGIEE